MWEPCLCLSRYHPEGLMHLFVSGSACGSCEEGHFFCCCCFVVAVLRLGIRAETHALQWPIACVKRRVCAALYDSRNADGFGESLSSSFATSVDLRSDYELSVCKTNISQRVVATSAAVYRTSTVNAGVECIQILALASPWRDRHWWCKRKPG